MCTKAVSVNVRALSDKLQSANSSHAALAEQQAGKGDVLPTDLAPVITHHRPKEIQYMRWGLVPAGTADLRSVAPMYNARAETLLQLRSFQGLVMTSRCLILNEGFYEFEKQGDERVQWKISPVGEPMFYKAGLWTTWRNPDTGELMNSFTMITCDPGAAKMSEVHNRMPVILNRQERRLWMHPQATLEQLMGLLKPCSDYLYRIEEYSRKPLKPAKQPKVKNRRPNDNNTNNTLF